MCGCHDWSWQLIDTAPTDGRVVLGVNAREPGHGARVLAVTRYTGFVWLHVAGHYAWAPTHWLPIPDLPTVK
jgi:hypothetical protein